MGGTEIAGRIYPAKSGKIELIDLLKEQMHAGYQPADRASIMRATLDRVVGDLEHGIQLLDALQNERDINHRNTTRELQTQKERDELYHYINGLLGLLQLIGSRDDVSAELKTVLRTNHRAADAAAYLTQIAKPAAPLTSPEAR